MAGNVKDVVKKLTEKPPTKIDCRFDEKPSQTRPKPSPPKKKICKLMYKSSTPEEATVSLQIMTLHGWMVVTLERPALSSDVRQEPKAVDDCLLPAMTPWANPGATCNATPIYHPLLRPIAFFNASQLCSHYGWKLVTTQPNHVLLLPPLRSYSFYLNAISNNHYSNADRTIALQWRYLGGNESFRYWFIQHKVGLSPNFK